ncbi:alkaline phosphatase family protein [Pedobacter metabolipauper]|uniref:Putative AlkP superfamily pyrophosphatase or phosphodiesterase n=1 Tax=Pedobacter metabolipauper TaxID=425513 RepID=A0A4R6SR41_9SPHI|nr:nucleotide pyrophosphatase/phosphodiesterase family protein [Pedobacter metabolipauper]TDQ06695.1 putative AlkP superfamily pyrophosphatase or phosphodiesterase [Pedobacter metabolipauper]
MKKTVVIDVVGLSANLIGKHTPFLEKYSKDKNLASIAPMLPAVTTAVQSTYLTGKLPSEHGIVGNGWYDEMDAEIKFWKQSNKLVLSDKIWDRAKKENPDFTCSNMFWWYNMYSNADYSATPRPNYLADGRKLPDFYSQPAELRDVLKDKLGEFPLFQFWGPGANIKSTRWIADAAMLTDDLHDPTLTLIYLPHLDYCLQKFGSDLSNTSKELTEVDAVIKDLVTFYENKNANVIILSEYGITPVSKPVHLNRIFRENGLLQIRVERGLELLDAGASKAFVVADHQIAHVYINDAAVTAQVKAILEKIPGIALILDDQGKKEHGMDHERAGDFVLVAKPESWFTYYFWLDDAKAPDYARCVDIHKKPGYDPVEMFMSSKPRAAYKLLRKKAGFRYVMDVIPLDATLIKGSHGSIDTPKEYHPVLITDKGLNSKNVKATDVYQLIWNSLTEKG